MNIFNQNENQPIVKKVKLIYNNEKIEKTLLFDEIDYETSKQMIIKNHYSHKWNTSFGKINIGVFCDKELLGVAVFGNLMNPNSYSTIIDDHNKDSVIELNRLWVDDKLGGNTETVLLSVSWNIIRKKYPNIKVVQSFADGRLGVGTIYKASSFKYFGQTKSLFFENIETKETYHQVPFANTKRPDGMIKLNTLLVSNKLKAFYVKTYRYIFVLYKNVKIKLQEQPYPTYEKGFEYIEFDKGDFIKEICRAYILAEILNYKEKEILKQHISLPELKKQINNNSIVVVSKERKLYEKYLEVLDKYNLLS